jgi:hypothetical protein
MALKKTVQFKGISVNDCYIKVWRIEGNKADLSFGVSYSANAQAEVFNSETYYCAHVLDGDNPIKQAYKHLKTLPEFAGATDC